MMKSASNIPPKKKLSATLVVIVLILGLAPGLTAVIAEAARPMPKASPKQAILDRYIVVLRQSVSDPEAAANRMSKRYRFNPHYTYRRAIKGYAARIHKSIVPLLKRDPDVAFIEPDRLVHALDQTLPTGVDRIQGDLNSTAIIHPIDEDIAIIDTGIDLDHPDLNVVHSVNCTGFIGGCGAGGDDGHGHGTHVAGISAARNNDIGVIGVAPGARLWAVRVLDNSASGYLSWILAGIEWVTAHADEIEVANLSLGWQGYSAAAHDAIRASVAKGVVYVVSAGNDADDVYGPDGAFGTNDDFCPAAYPEVAAISAFVDSDGEAGGNGAGTAYGPDDTFATFSNYSANVVADNPVNSPGLAIDLLCPGVSIYSTYKNGGYASGSGTSTSSPHAAGLAALYIAANGRATDASGVYDIRQALIDNGIPQNSAEGLADPNDPDEHWEYIGWAQDSEPLANDIAVVTISAPQTVVAGETVEITVEIRNIGSANATNFSVNLIDEFDGEETIIDTWEVGELAASESTNLTFDWDTMDSSLGNHTLTASLDSLNVGDEYSDENPDNDSKSTLVEVISSDTPTTLHVADLDGIGTRLRYWWVWQATVNIYISDNLNEPVEGAYVDIDWSDGSIDGCITNSNGMCQIVGYQWGWYNSIALRIYDIYHQLEYKPAENRDPDGDSNGTIITIYRP